MTRTAFALTALTWACLAGTQPANAEALSKEEMLYVAVMLSTAIVIANCGDRFDIIDGGLQKFGDINGVDGAKYGAAVVAAMKALGGLEYDRSDLIPEVTRQVTSVSTELASSLSAGKPTFCKKWGAMLVDKSVITRK